MPKISKVLIIVLIIPLLCLVVVGCHTGLGVTILSPVDGTTVYVSPIPVNGTVSDPSAKVTINNTPVVVAENGYFIGAVDLVEGEYIITAIATVEGQETITKSITVTYVSGD